MKAEDLLQAIGDVQEDLIERAAKKKTPSHRHWLYAAASLLVIIGLVTYVFRSNSVLPDEKPPAESTDSIPPADVDLSAWKLALVTDYGDVTDQSFNQVTYGACMEFSETYGVDFQYYKPCDNSTDSRVASIEQAIAEGHNVIIFSNYAFGGAIVEMAPKHPNVKFIGLDVAVGDLLEAGVAAAGESYDYNPDNWILEDYVDMSNVYCCTYREEIAGYLAGYAAVQMGYTELGFLGGMAVPAVIRYGYGFVQGADAAAAENGAQVEIKYIYGGQFFGDSDITDVMHAWYGGGTQAVFACGGGVYTSAAEAAMKVDGKIIGVDNDQAGIIDGAYGEDMTLTSAMKAIGPTAFDTLEDIIVYGNWENYAGKIENLGLEENKAYLQLPMDSTQWNENFTQEEYIQLLEDITSGNITVSADISEAPETNAITVAYLGNIKG